MIRCASCREIPAQLVETLEHGHLVRRCLGCSPVAVAAQVVSAAEPRAIGGLLDALLTARVRAELRRAA